MSERVLYQAVYSLIKELEVQTDRRVKGEVKCKCERGVKCECEHEHEAKAQSEICPVGCILFVLLSYLYVQVI